MNDKPGVYVHSGSELALTNPVFIDILKGVLEKGAHFRFHASGWSMSPFIKNGDVLTLMPITPSSLSAGDVIAFVEPESGHLIVHRLICMSKGTYMFKGDNISKIDGALKYSSLLGKVCLVERNDKTVHIGLGPEKHLIATLSRINLLIPYNRLITIISRSIKKVNA